MRISSDEYYMSIAILASLRSTCARRHVGAILVKEDCVVCEGYNGAPRKAWHCTKETCLRTQMNVPSGQRHEICRAVHAEQNVITEAAMLGISIAGGKLYVTDSPCIICAKLLINAGVKEIVYGREYSDPNAMQMLKDAGIRCEYLPVEDVYKQMLNKLSAEFN